MKLNKIERLKLVQSPWEYYKKLETLQKIGEIDRFYLKNFGIYNMKLRADKFMLRLRFPAGRVTSHQLEAIWQEIVQKEVELLITSRAQIEIHNLTLYEAITMHKNLEQHGVTSFQTLTDNIRNIVTDPLDGKGKGSILEVYNIIQDMQKIFLYKKEFLGMLPRKCNVAISGMQYNIVSFFGNDIFFGLAKRGGEFGFRLYLGGRHSDLARDTGIFIPPKDTVRMFYAIILAYKKYGLRSSRTKARLYHLIEAIGLEGFKERIKEFYPKNFIYGGELLISKREIDDCIELNDGSFATRYRTNFGRLSKDIFYKIVQLSKQYEIRFGADQNLYIFGAKNINLPQPIEYKNVIVCAGEHYCAYSLLNTKEQVKDLPLLLLKQNNIRLHYSGCLKGCARHILADIGLVGIRTNLFGQVERGVRVYVGGEYTYGKAPARLIFWAVPLRKISFLLEVIVRDFIKSGFNDFEEYAKKLREYSSEQVAFYYLQLMEKAKGDITILPTAQQLKEKEQELFR